MNTFEHILEHLPDGLLVVDETGCIVRANGTAAKLFGYAVEALVGLPVERLVPARLGDRHRAHRARFQAQPHARSMGLDFELSGRRQDGTEFPVDVMLSPMDTDGLRQVVCVVRDVTERRRTEDLMRDLLESAPDAMVIVDDRGVIRRVNAQTERLFGWSRDELLGHPVEMLMPARLRDAHLGHRAGFFEAPRMRPMGAGRELRGLRKNGEEFPIEISLSPLQTRDGTLISSAIRDVTEQERARRLILESLREKDMLLKEVHHRVKNNLAVISSLLYLEGTTTRDEPVLKLLQESRDRVRSMSLVHETLYQSDDLSSVNFAEYARTLGEELARSHRRPGMAVVLNTRLQPVHLGIDVAVPCGLILNELLTNAFKHAYPGGAGEIEVVVSPAPGSRCELRVVDHGVGLSTPPPAGQEPQGASPANLPQTLGQRLIRSLARQLDAEFHYHPTARGTDARLTVPLERA